MKIINIESNCGILAHEVVFISFTITTEIFKMFISNSFEMQSSSLKTSWSIKIYNKAREFIAAIELNFYFRSDRFIMKIIIYTCFINMTWAKILPDDEIFFRIITDFFVYIVGKLLLQWKQNICLFTQIVTLPYRE